MLKRAILILIIILLPSANIHAEEYKKIEIFDIDKEKVVKVVKSNSKIQKAAVSYINEITGIYCKLKPIPDKGYGIKIFLQPSVTIKNKWIDTVIDEVIIIIPKDEGPPFLIIFENEDKLLCFTFKGDIDILLKKLKFP